LLAEINVSGLILLDRTHFMTYFVFTRDSRMLCAS